MPKHVSTRVTKQFKVVSVSANANGFGLRGMVLLAQDGEAWEVGANHLNVKEKGDIVEVRLWAGNWDFAHLGYEIPRKHADAPPAVVAEAWTNAVEPQYVESVGYLVVKVKFRHPKKMDREDAIDLLAGELDYSVSYNDDAVRITNTEVEGMLQDNPC